MRILSFIFCLLVFQALSQSDSLKASVVQTQAQSNARFSDDRIIYRYAAIGGVSMHTRGLNFYFRKYYNKDWYNSQYWQIDFATIKHRKEVKITPFEGDAKGYVFGKLNSLSALRGTYGRQKILFDKEQIKGVQIGLNASVGFSLGLVKPVYLEVEYPFVIDGRNVEIERYDPDVHDRTKIIGRAPFAEGLEELKFYPGVHTKVGLYTEYAAGYEYIRSIEVGAMLDAFYKQVPIMAFTNNSFAFFSLYVSWQFGKRFNTHKAE